MEEKKKASLEKRRAKLVVALGGVQPEQAVPFQLRGNVYGDFLDGSRIRPTKCLRAVRASVATYRRYFGACQKLCRTPEDAQKEASCIHLFRAFYEDEAQYAATREKLAAVGILRDRVFEQEWFRILEFLGPRDVRNLRHALPVFAMARHARFRATKKAMEEALLGEPELDESEVWRKPILRLRVQHTFRGRFRRTAKSIDEFRQIFTHYKQCIARKNELQEELGRYGLELRGDSHFCAEYVTGGTTASLDEVVATMRVTTFLFDTGGPRVWSMNRCRLEAHMRNLAGKGMRWSDACEETMRLPLVWEDFDF